MTWSNCVPKYGLFPSRTFSLTPVLSAMCPPQAYFLYDYLQASQPLFIKSMGLLVHSSHGLPSYSPFMQPRYPYLWLLGFALANPETSGIWWHSGGSANICFWRTLPVKCGGRIGKSQNSCTSRTLSPHGQKYFLMKTTHLSYSSFWRTLRKKTFFLAFQQDMTFENWPGLWFIKRKHKDREYSIKLYWMCTGHLRTPEDTDRKRFISW